MAGRRAARRGFGLAGGSPSGGDSIPFQYHIILYHLISISILTFMFSLINSLYYYYYYYYYYCIIDIISGAAFGSQFLGNTNRVVSNRVVSKGPLYPSKTKIIFFCFLIRPRLFASDNPIPFHSSRHTTQMVALAAGS